MASRLSLVILFFLLTFSIGAQALGGTQSPGGTQMSDPPDFGAAFPSQGDASDRYAEWAQSAMNEGRWAEALSVLERAGDYAGVSSDLSYMLALARHKLWRPLGSVLRAIEEALEAERWRKYSASDAHLLKAELLIKLKRYGEALSVLSYLPECPESVILKLKALRFLPAHDEFRNFIGYALDRYPGENGPVRIYLDFLQLERKAGRFPAESDHDFLLLIFRRLPALLLRDPELAWMAAPFTRDSEEARRLIAAYRAVNRPDPRSLPAALNFGVIDEETAIAELFEGAAETLILDRAVLEETGGLLRDETRRRLFARNLSRWTGVIKEDADGDGFFEAEALYEKGLLAFYTLDWNQDFLSDLTVEFEAGEPKAAAVTALAEEGDERPPYPLSEEDERKISLRWERFPACLEARLAEEKYFFRPFEYNYAPVIFYAVAGSGLLFPEADPLGAAIGRRSLVLNCIRLERPGAGFASAVETVTLNRGIPLAASELLDGRVVSETDFLRGRPIAQRADLDLDGRMETFRRFRRAPSSPGSPLDPPESLVDYERDFEYADSDWDGDGIFETRQFL